MRPDAATRPRSTEGSFNNMRIECYTELDEAALQEWRVFMTEARHQHSHQDPKFAIIERAAGRSPIFVIGRDDDRILAVGWFSRHPSRLFPGRFAVAKSLSGPVSDSADAMIAFLDAIIASRDFSDVDALTITPYWLDDEGRELASHLARSGWSPSEAEWVRKTGIIDLTRPVPEIRDSFSRSARRKVRLVEKSEIVIRRLTTLDEASVFFERLNRLVLRRARWPETLPAEHPLAIENVPGQPSGASIHAAYKGDVFLGGVLVYRNLISAHAVRYVADPEAADAVADRLRVAPSVWLAGMLWAKEQGCSIFDVEGYQEVDDPSHPLFNVYEYKREFSPTLVQRLREHTYPLRPALHALNTLPRRLRSLVKERAPTLATRFRTPH